MTEKRSIDLSVEVPGTPEQVWDAIATGPGISSWFIRAEMDGEVGGQMTMDFGSFGTETATVTAWEPPRRLVYESSGDRALAYEWLVEARNGGSCVVRLVNSGFGTGADWDGEYDGMSSGWRIFLDSLALHMAHFPGRAAQPVTPTFMVPGPNAAGWSTLCAALGLPEGLRAGDRFATSGPDVPPLAGSIVSRRTSAEATACMLLLDEPAPGTGFLAAEGAGEQVACSMYLYLHGASGERPDDPWTGWLASRFPAPTSDAQGADVPVA